MVMFILYYLYSNIISGDEKSQPIILQLIREGKPEGECSMLLFQLERK